jgi:hypothetical protein
VRDHPHCRASKHRSGHKCFDGDREHARKPRTVPNVNIEWSFRLLCPFKDVADGLGVPLPASRRRDTSGIQSTRNLP